MTKTTKCVAKHEGAKEVPVTDDKTGKPFFRTNCVHCGIWMSDRLSTSQPSSTRSGKQRAPYL